MFTTNLTSLFSLVHFNAHTISFQLSVYQLINLFKEYFVSADLDEFFRCISELNEPVYSYEVVKRSVNMSLDKREKERELVSKMISVSYPDFFSSNVIARGFERLLEISPEIEKDVPSSTEMIGAFIARSVSDEVLAPSFLNDPVICNLGGRVIEYAKRMLSREHVGARIEKVWGPGDGRPVQELKIAVDQLLYEYLLSRELVEASRCIKELNAPHFHYEIVKRAIVMALEKSEENQSAVSELFVNLAERDFISSLQFEAGFLKVFSMMSDLILDTPNALTIVSEFVNKAIQQNVLTPDFWSKVED